MNAVLTASKVPVSPLASAGRGSHEITLRQTFILKNRRGLHLRPAALLVTSLSRFTCRVNVESCGVVVNARSIFELMCLAASCGAKLNFVCTGNDAPAAIAAIQGLFATNFAAAYAE